jgi:hypothetical protein
MPVTIHIWDEVVPGQRSSSDAVTVQQSETTAREIIRNRVQQEVERHNQSLPYLFQGLFQPVES